MPPEPIFVVQEHDARRLHWDFRLERDGVLVSWALPKGVPDDPKRNHLAVPTDDHAMEYATFSGTIPGARYGAGTVEIWDSGTYTCEEWTDDKVKVVLHGTRVQGRFVLFRASGKDWMIHRMDPAKQPMPRLVRPMLATLGELPDARHEADWSFEMKWDGVRLVAYLDGTPGSLRLLTRNDRDVTATYPELAGLAADLDGRPAVLDGEVVALDPAGRPSFEVLQQRMHVKAPATALLGQVPVTYLVFDLLHLDGEALLRLPYATRRARLDDLALSGTHWQTPPHFPGSGADALRVSGEQGLEGVLAKRNASTYRPGARSKDWVKVKHVRMQEVVVGGWTEGEGNRSGRIGALLLGVYDEPGGGLRYAGHVGTGFDGRILEDLARRLARLSRQTSPFDPHRPVPRPDAAKAHWVTPRLVGEVGFAEWTRDGRLRHPVWRGLRPDKSPVEVHPET